MVESPGQRAGIGEWGARNREGKGGVRRQRRPECGGGTEIPGRGTGAAGAQYGVRVGDSVSLSRGCRNRLGARAF